VSVNLSSSGRYRCEISGEAPSFNTVDGYGDMVVVGMSKFPAKFIKFSQRFPSDPDELERHKYSAHETVFNYISLGRKVSSRPANISPFFSHLNVKFPFSPATRAK
jgi:hypothetical protein